MAKEPTSNSVLSVKITGIDRDGIVRRALEAAFDKEKAALAKRETALCRRCYNAIFPASIRKMVDAIPAEWIDTSQRASFNVGGLHIELSSEDVLRVPASNGYRLGTIKDRSLIDAVNDLLEVKREYGERRKQARVATEAIINSCSTTKQLREVWPQGEQFYKHIEPPARPQLPAAQIQQLNEMLGLKKAA